jgi:hypothetical protein
MQKAVALYILFGHIFKGYASKIIMVLINGKRAVFEVAYNGVTRRVPGHLLGARLLFG